MIAVVIFLRNDGIGHYGRYLRCARNHNSISKVLSLEHKFTSLLIKPNRLIKMIGSRNQRLMPTDLSEKYTYSVSCVEMRPHYICGSLIGENLKNSKQLFGRRAPGNWYRGCSARICAASFHMLDACEIIRTDNPGWARKLQSCPVLSPRRDCRVPSMS